MECSVFIRHASIITLCALGALSVQSCTAKLYTQETKQALEAEA